MKRKIEKLTLNRETVRHLNGEELREIAAGKSGIACSSNCTPCPNCGTV